jgi:hypothetical protein
MGGSLDDGAEIAIRKSKVDILSELELVDYAQVQLNR